MLENRDFEKMANYAIDSVVVDLTDWYGRHPTGAIAYSSDLCVCSDYCDSVEDYEEFFDLIKDNLNINVRLTVNMDMDALGDTVPFAEKVKEAFDRVKRRTEHHYGMRNRGFSPGCQPLEGLIECIHDETEENGRSYYDKLVYNRKLTDKELSDYELDYLGPMPEDKELAIKEASNSVRAYTRPTRVLFLNEKEDFIHGGIAIHRVVIDLTDGETYSLGDIEIKSVLPWRDLEEAAVGDEMDYYSR